MQNIEYAIISAAGLGSRLGLNQPKCLVEISGRKIIDLQLELLKDVPNVRVVVGFMENEVIEYVKSVRDDVLFVRNPYYNTTTNCHSLWLGSYDLDVDFLAVDGDLLIPKKSFEYFTSNVKAGETLIGVTKAKTEDAVFVDFDNKKSLVRSFSREVKYKYEWTGLVYLSGLKIDKDIRYVYNILEKGLPSSGCEIDCYEIDTPQDLELTRKNFEF